jgi:capsule polysaccharide export protein KpsC/LpsZ
MDQLHLLKIISINLPAETILIVKEHPLSANIRPTGFYDVIRSLPNVKLIYEGYSKKELILRSKGILTITGSIGYESWLLGKPVIVFGNVFFDNFKNVFDCKNFDLLFTTFCRLLKGDYNQLEESYKHKIDEFIFEKCTIDGNIFNYENKFNQLTIEDKINDMKSVFSFILNDINE